MKTWRPYAWIVLAALALYLRTVRFGFTFLDDGALILDNQGFLRDWSSVIDAFRQDVFHVLRGTTAYYRPLFMVSLVLDAHWSGAAAYGYHLTNVLIHAAGSCALFFMLERMRYARGPAFFFALAFAVHPLATQNVCSLACRDDALLGVFVFAAFGAFARFLETGGRGDLARHLLFFVLALFAKETGVILIPACLLYLHLVARKCLSSRKALQLGASWLPAVALWALLRYRALSDPLRMDLPEMLRSVSVNLPALLQTAGKILLPFNLADLPMVGETTQLYGVAAVVFTAGALWAGGAARRRHVVFGACWFVLFLAPSLVLGSTSFAGIVPEKRAYVPMAGFIMILLEAGLVRRLVSPEGRPRAFGLAVLAALAVLSFRFSDHYRDRLSFWRHAASASPRLPLARRNLGAMYLLDGRLEEAEPEFQEALRLNPAEPMVHNNLGLIRAGRGRLAEAEAEYLKEIALNPRFDHARFNLGLVYARLGRLQQAKARWLETLEINPDYAQAHHNLAAVLLQEGRPGEAAVHLEWLRRRGLIAPGAAGE